MHGRCHVQYSKDKFGRDKFRHVQKKEDGAIRNDSVRTPEISFKRLSDSESDQRDEKPSYKFGKAHDKPIPQDKKGNGKENAPLDLSPIFERLGLDKEDLANAKKAGKTVAEAAEEQGISRQELIDAIAEYTGIKEHLDYGVQQGKFTREDADAILEEYMSTILDSKL